MGFPEEDLETTFGPSTDKVFNQSLRLSCTTHASATVTQESVLTESLSETSGANYRPGSLVKNAPTCSLKAASTQVATSIDCTLVAEEACAVFLIMHDIKFA